MPRFVGRKRVKNFPVMLEASRDGKFISHNPGERKELLSRRICRLDGKMVDAVGRGSAIRYFPVNVREPPISRRRRNKSRSV